MAALPCKPFRFGLNAWETQDAASWRDFVIKAEDLGYSTVVVPDHVVFQQLAPIAAVATAAAHTTTLRVGMFVLANDLRHPAVLAKELATIDLLSDGRLEIGIGAGWAASDYAFLHQSFDSGRTRVERLGEAVTVLKRYFSGSPVEFDGEHYHVGADGLTGLPHVAQRPHPPILMGGGGPKMLALAAREADIIGLNTLKRSAHRIDTAPAQSLGETEAAAQIELIRTVAGQRFESLEINANVMSAIVTNDSTGAALGITPAVRTLVEQAATETRALCGTVGQIIETCQRRRDELGINYIVLPHTAIDAFAPVVARLAAT